MILQVIDMTETDCFTIQLLFVLRSNTALEIHNIEM